MCVEIVQLLQVVVVSPSGADTVPGGCGGDGGGGGGGVGGGVLCGDVLVQELARVAAQCHFFMAPSNDLLPLASAVVSLLWALVKVVSSSEEQERVFSSIQIHWSSFTG